MSAYLRPPLRLIARIVAYGLVIPVLTLIEPFWRIRLTHFWTARFGPMCLAAHNWAVERRMSGPEPRTFRIFFGAKPANSQLWAMWKRVMPIIDSRVLSALYHYAGHGLAKTRFFEPLSEHLSSYDRVNQPAGLIFIPDETRRGETLLRDMGIGPDDWFVTFQVRDRAFHAQIPGRGDNGGHRNGDIESYLPAIAEVTARGGFGVRMGAAVERPLPDTGDARIIDYPSRFRSAFGDIWLFSRCRFHLGSSTGSTNCPPLFGRPVAQANTFPPRPVPTGKSGLYFPSPMRDVASGRILTWGEMEKLGAFQYDDWAVFQRWHQPAGLQEMGLEVVGTPAEEVRDLCLDMLDRMDGVPVDPEIAEMQHWFNHRYFAHVPTIDLAPDIAPSFIRRYRHLLD